MAFAPSKYQQAVFDFVTTGTGSAVIEAVAGANDDARTGARCSECGRHVGHYPECSQHYSRKPRAASADLYHGCFACSRGNYGPGSEHTCGVWGVDV